MNWKNVLRLIRVNIKAGRLIRGQRLRKYREQKIFQYLEYGGACLIGVLVGLAVGIFFTGVPDPELKALFYQGAPSFFLSLPTLILIYSLVFTMMGQIQRMGVRASLQLPYWLPIAWEEHTLASILAHLVGVPLASLILFSSAIATVSTFLGEMPFAIVTIFALIASTFLASTTTEIFRILQVRFIGAVYRSTGKAAIWVRFIGSLIFLVAFYIVWFAFTSGTSSIALIESVAGAQQVVWFIPYVWLGMVLAAFMSGLFTQAVIFSLASLLFILILFYVAVRLNARFGLYEPPAITVSRGVYAPRVGFLGKLGFSSLEAAIIRKDFKAFTRRRELMYIFIMPIVFIIMPLLSSIRGTAGAPFPSAFYPFLFAYLTLLPGTIIAVSLGSVIIGSEGESVWYFYSFPISAKSLVKAKYFFATLVGFAVTLVCFFVDVLLTSPSVKMATTGLVEAILLVLSLGMVSLTFGIEGADFRELPRPRMIRPMWALVNGIVCLLLALVIVSPVIPYGLRILFGGILAPLTISISLPESYLYIALLLSGVIAFVVTYVFHRMAVRNAEKLLLKAEE